ATDAAREPAARASTAAARRRTSPTSTGSKLCGRMTRTGWLAAGSTAVGVGPLSLATGPLPNVKLKISSLASNENEILMKRIFSDALTLIWAVIVNGELCLVSKAKAIVIVAI